MLCKAHPDVHLAPSSSLLASPQRLTRMHKAPQGTPSLVHNVNALFKVNDRLRSVSMSATHSLFFKNIHKGISENLVVMHLHVIFFFSPHINGLKLTSVFHFLFEFLSLVEKNFRIFKNVLNFFSVANLTNIV